MGTTAEFIEYVCDQLEGLEEIRYKKCLGNIWFI